VLNQKQLARNAAGILFVLPGLVLYAVFFLYPFFNSILLSFTDWDGVQPIRNFVGGANYLRLSQDPMVWMSLSHNLIWVIVGTIAPVLIGLLLAVLFWSGSTKGQVIFRTAFFMPVVLSPVVVGIIWGWIYSPIFGILNRVLEAVGLGFIARGWLGDPTWALFAVLGTAVWSYFGFCFVILLAGLQNADLELYDAAKLDGASSWQQLLNVTIPQLQSVLSMVIVYTLIGGFNVFDIVFVMTGGGPANLTELIATYTYKKSFMENQVGYGASLTMVMTVLSLAASFVFLKLRERGEK
jgi:multiple sugar transport system permease protein/raffinose/stachyose/melibiose transport system permease protein